MDLKTHSSPLEQSWQHLVEQSQQLRHAVDQEDWSRAGEVASARHNALLNHFEHYPVGPDTADFYHTHLAALLTEEPQLHALAVQARREAMKQGLEVSHNRRAINAYTRQP